MAVEGKFRQGITRASTPAAVWILVGVAVAGIWLGAVLSSIFAPDFVSGSQQDHLPLVGWVDWIWAIASTSFVVLAAQKGIRAGISTLTPWIAMAVGVVAVWAGVFVITVISPVFVTGTDPTRIPMAAMGVPIVGTFLTWFVCTLFKSSFDADTT